MTLTVLPAISFFGIADFSKMEVVVLGYLRSFELWMHFESGKIKSTK